MKKFILFVSLIFCFIVVSAQTPVKINTKYFYQIWKGDSLKAVMYGDSVMISGTSAKYILNEYLYLNKFAAAGGADTLLLFLNGTTGKVDTIRYNAITVGLADSANVAAYAWTLQTLDTNEVYIGAAGQTGQCITAYKDTVKGCSSDWVNIKDSLHVMGILDIDSSIRIDGYRALYSSILSGNIFGGYSGLFATGMYNTGFGYNSLPDITTAQGNSALGNTSLFKNINGSYNTSIGTGTLSQYEHSSYNTAIGYWAGYNPFGNYCIYLGAKSGFYIGDSLDNRIFINSLDRGSEKADTTHSIIYGKQDADSSNQDLWLNANVHILGRYQLPPVDGSANQVLTTNGAGVVSWQPTGSGSVDSSVCNAQVKTHQIKACSDLLILGGMNDSISGGRHIYNTTSYKGKGVNGSMKIINYPHNAYYFCGIMDSTTWQVTGMGYTNGASLGRLPKTLAAFVVRDSTKTFTGIAKNSLRTELTIDTTDSIRFYIDGSLRTFIDRSGQLYHSGKFYNINGTQGFINDINYLGFAVKVCGSVNQVDATRTWYDMLVKDYPGELDATWDGYNKTVGGNIKNIKMWRTDTTSVYGIAQTGGRKSYFKLDNRWLTYVIPNGDTLIKADTLYTNIKLLPDTLKVGTTAHNSVMWHYGKLNSVGVTSLEVNLPKSGIKNLYSETSFGHVWRVKTIGGAGVAEPIQLSIDTNFIYKIWCNHKMSGVKVVDSITVDSTCTYYSTGAIVSTPADSLNAFYQINATTGINASMVAHHVIRVAGHGGAIDISANPQIAAGYDGQVIEIWCESDANTVKFDDGNGLQLPSSYTLGQGDYIELRYFSDVGVWRFKGYSDN